MLFLYLTYVIFLTFQHKEKQQIKQLKIRMLCLSKNIEGIVKITFHHSPYIFKSRIENKV